MKRRDSIALRLKLTGCSILLGLCLVEGALRLMGWSPSPKRDGYLQFGYSSGIPIFDEDGILKVGKKVKLFRHDPDLFWVPIENTPVTNSRGMRGTREFSKTKQPGKTRLAFLGDSCSFLGDPLYPDLIEDGLSGAETLNFSVPGYSIYQGLRRLQYALSSRPDVVSFYFGWNDHWYARGGLTDAMQYNLSRGLRLFDLVRLFYVRRVGGPTVRVPLPEFKSLLQKAVKVVKKAGAVPILITAPTGFADGRMPAWSYPFFKQSYEMGRSQVDEIPAVHNRYMNAVREIAREESAVLVDALAEFDRLTPTTRNKLFYNDQIHLRTLGHKLVARLWIQSYSNLRAAKSK